MTDTNQELEQVQREALDLGRRLGILLATAPMPDEQKEAWIALIPSMSAEQMAEFATALEGMVPDAEEQGFADLAKSLAGAETRRTEAVAAATATAQQSLDDIEKELTV